MISDDSGPARLGRLAARTSRESIPSTGRISLGIDLDHCGCNKDKLKNIDERLDKPAGLEGSQ